MIFDFDDFHQTNNRLDLFWELKTLRPDFKCTVFAVPAMGSEEFWENVPDWLELAVHGWKHPHPREAQHWSYKKMDDYMHSVSPRFVHGFKAPGWQISDASFEWLKDNGWWVADQAYNDERRPEGLKHYVLGPNSHHFHVQDIGSNGMVESWDNLTELVKKADNFQFVSEVV